ncbi:hypothetical protein CXU16_03055 [Akkermansia muciniphila]|nr:hypothetical protein CXU16_03055 [Akkermansia muciniphila]
MSNRSGMEGGLRISITLRLPTGKRTECSTPSAVPGHRQEQNVLSGALRGKRRKTRFHLVSRGKMG